MNPCNVTIDIFGEPSSFECSSHEVAVSITDVFQWGPDGRATKNVVRHTQGLFYSMPPQASIDTDIDHEVDYSFHETFGAAHGWL